MDEPAAARAAWLSPRFAPYTVICVFVLTLLSRSGTLGINLPLHVHISCILTKTSEAEAPERKGNRSRNREEPFCVVDSVDGFTSGEANNGDSGDRKSAAGCCGSGLNLFSSGAASSVFAATASGGDRGATTHSPPPDAEDFLCNLGESPLDIVIFAFPFYIAEAASRFETSFFKQHRVEGSSLS